MALDPALLAILACPEDKGPLYYFESTSRCCTTPACTAATRSATASR